MKYLTLFVSVGFLMGCGPSHVGASTSLTQPVAVQVGAVANSQVSFTIAGGYANPSPVTMSVRGPTVKLHTLAGRGELDAFELPLGDVTVPASAIPPKGLILRNLVLQAGPGHAEVMHAEDEALELRASLRAANDEAGLLTAPGESVQVVGDALRSAAEQLEAARGHLRALGKLLGVG